MYRVISHFSALYIYFYFYLVFPNRSDPLSFVFDFSSFSYVCRGIYYYSRSAFDYFYNNEQFKKFRKTDWYTFWFFEMHTCTCLYAFEDGLLFSLQKNKSLIHFILQLLKTFQSIVILPFVQNSHLTFTIM